MIGRVGSVSRVGALPLVAAGIMLAAGCSQRAQPGASSNAPAEMPASPSSSALAAPARDVTNKNICGLVTAETLTNVAFPVTAGQPLSAGAFRFCRFAAVDRAGVAVPDSVMIGALPSGAAGAGEHVMVDGTPGSQVLTTSECTLLLDTKSGTLQVIVARTGKGPNQCAIAQKVAKAALPKL